MRVNVRGQGGYIVDRTCPQDHLGHGTFASIPMLSSISVNGAGPPEWLETP